MKHEHRNIQLWIKEKYNIEAEVDKQNNLPDETRHWYRPDVVIKNKNGEIEYIIEVEGDPIRKAIVGASILADASLKDLNENAKLYFVIYDPNGIRQIPNMQAKAEIAKPYCNNIDEIEVISFEEFRNIKL